LAVILLLEVVAAQGHLVPLITVLVVLAEAEAHLMVVAAWVETRPLEANLG
jgi:hypothetical protein